MFRMKDFRADHNLLQSEVAKLLGLSQPSMSRIENEGLDLSPAQMDILKQTYGDDVERYVLKIDSFANGGAFTALGSPNGQLNIEKFLSVLSKQMELIQEQMAQQNETTKMAVQTNERLVKLLEKLSDEFMK